MSGDGSAILVTGGAGYVGSHVVKALAEAGHQVVVYDNLSTGFGWSVLDAELVVGDLADQAALRQLFATRRFDAVMHFAASIWVGESVREPARYYRNNVANALNLLEAAAAHGTRSIVFSSTAAVYGEPNVELLDETLPTAPINPYGASKAMTERVLQDIAAATGLRYAILRYFNVAGADPEGRIGEATPDNRHLIKVACEAAIGLRPHLQINGTDYPTPDGTCIRDYIHVTDLARAHVDALDYLRAGGASTICNCGYGHGLSVRQVVEAVRRVTGVTFPVKEGPRRPGDPPALIASNAKIRRVLGWMPRYDDLDMIVGSAWRWEQILQTRGQAADRSVAGPGG
jgi:UDP-glucose 4-epimerase